MADHQFQDHEKKKVDGSFRYDHGSDSSGKPEEGAARRASVSDAVFGEISEDGPNYRSVGWKGTTVLMLKTQIGLGVLSIPSVFNTLGLIPGVLIVIVMGIMTGWSNYIVGVFKLRHTDVYGIDDAGRKLFGRAGYEIFGITFALYWVFIAGSGMLGIATGLNALSSHGACTAVFVAIAALIAFGLGSIQTLGRISFLAWVGVVSIFSAIFTLTIAVGVDDRPALAPVALEPFKSNYVLIAHPSTPEALAAVSSIVFAYAGTPAFFNIISEMRDPRQYTKALVICQSVMIVIYTVVGVVVYYFCGSYVASPALGSAGKALKKVCYGLGIPGLIVSTTLFVHFGSKYFFMRSLRGSKHLVSNSFIHWATWIGCTSGVTITAYLIASAIPVFGGLVSLVGALLGTLMSLQPMGLMWWYDNKNKARTGSWYFWAGWSVFIVVSGTFLTIGGTYGSVMSIITSYKRSGGSAAWSCADNSNS